MIQRLRDRDHAGQLLAKMLRGFDHAAGTIVMALPRGGVVVGFTIAQALHLPHDVCVVRKLGVPWQPELAMGAIALGGITFLNQELIAGLGISLSEINNVSALERKELLRREKEYRGKRALPALTGITVIVVDDGIATGATMEAAVRVLRQGGASHIVIATGVASTSTSRRLAQIAGEVYCAIQPEELSSISDWFGDFDQVTDGEVRSLLARSESAHY